MKKLYILLLSVFYCFPTFAQQQIVIYTETFENGSNVFDFSTGGPGTNSGTNGWTVNDNFTGGGLYPDTPPQDSIAGGGNIAGAPYSHYLHIQDSLSSISNCNWNTNTTSDRFTFIGSSFCTLSMSDVIFTFFWIAEGDTNAYGEVYYRIGGGPWIKTGQSKYFNQPIWKLERISDPAFDNVQNLQFGFRWVNPVSSINPNLSFGIDDIITIGTYDEINNPVTINITSVSPQVLCQGDYIAMNYTLSSPLCDGSYTIEISDRNGNNFVNANYVPNIFEGDTIGTAYIPVPNDTGTCFKVRITRLASPVITGTASVCFTINDCPESIFTSEAPVMNDNDTTCILSAIDVKFYSFGVFGPGTPLNTYTAQLSDSTGSFANPFKLGTLVSDESFQGPPGTVSGLIPANVPPGCGYYIRVISNKPSTIGSRIGPFCLVQCDELTNNHTDLNFCIHSVSPPTNLCEPLVIHPNQWTNQASYDTCNKWTVELRSMMNFSLVNSGGLGVYQDSLGGNFTLCVPSEKDSLPVAPGAYYMRLVSSCSNQLWNQTGSVVRITIGAPDTIPPVISLPDTVACNVGIVALYVNPFNHPPSDYEWASNGLGNPAGTPFIWPSPQLLINFNGAPVDDYYFTVRELNFGCYGPYSDRAKLTITTTPSVKITGDTTICLGDTVAFRVSYLKETYYKWYAPSGVHILDESNSQVSMIFDSVGTFIISNFSLNVCGSDSNTYRVHVKTLYSVDAGADTTVCEGSPIQIQAEVADVNKVFFTKETTTALGKQGAMFNIIAHKDVVIDSFAVKYLTTSQMVQQEIYGKTGSYRTFEQNSGAWNLIGNNPGFQAKPNTQFTMLPISLNGGAGQAIAANDSFAFYLTTTNATAVNMQFSSGIGSTQGTVYKTDGVIDYVQGTFNNYPFGSALGPRVLNVRIYYTTKAGVQYLWNTGDTSATLITNPLVSGSYKVVIYDTSGCKNSDSMLVAVKPAPNVNAGNDTVICIGETVQLTGVNEGAVLWIPSSGISNDTILNPVFSYNQSVSYVLSSTGVNGCSKKDTVNIVVQPLPTVSAGPDTGICIGAPYFMPATTSGDSVRWLPAVGLDNPDTISPSFTSLVSMQYVLFVKDIFGCNSQDTVLIKVGTPPMLNAGLDTNFCGGEEYILTAVTDGQNIVWSPSDGLSSDSIINPVFSYNQSIVYVLSASDSNGCSKQDSLHIVVYPKPLINAGLDTALCNGTTYPIQGTASDGIIRWLPVLGLDNPTIINPVFTSSTTKEYTVSVTDSFGCRSLDTLVIKVGRTPVLNVGPDTVLCAGDEYIFPAITDGQTIVWNPSTGLDNPTISNPTFTGDSSEYTVIASDTVGCIATDTVNVSRRNCDVYLKVPQAFSPNGDGHNDHFTVFGGNITEYEIKIFNRWGELVYSSTNLSELNDLSRGWDGTFKGKIQELGTFVYSIHAIDIRGKKYDQKGNITLVR